MAVPPLVSIITKSSHAQHHGLADLKDLLVGGAPLKADVEQLLLNKYPQLQLRQGIFMPPPPQQLHDVGLLYVLYSQDALEKSSAATKRNRPYCLRRKGSNCKHLRCKLRPNRCR